MTKPKSEPGANVTELREKLRSLREIFLANLIMTSEIPSPTFGEGDRAEFILQRFSEAGLAGGSLDEAGNAAVELPGEDPDRRILVVAHTDTTHPAEEDHSVSVLSDRLVGPGIGDNATGVAAMMTLPRMIATCRISLRSTLVLLGAGRSLGRGNLEGLRFFLDHAKHPFAAGLCVEGVELGRLNHMAMGLLRAEIACRIPREYDWTRFGAANAIVLLNEIINRIQGIPLPGRPKTEILFGQMSGGTAFNRTPRAARLRFDVQSECAETLAAIEERIRSITEELAHRTRAAVSLDVVARREPGGIPFEHPYVREARRILDALDIEARIGPSTSELSAFLQRGIPALTIGITRGENPGDPNETIAIDPLFDGLAQLLALLVAMDQGDGSDDD